MRYLVHRNEVQLRIRIADQRPQVPCANGHHEPGVTRRTVDPSRKRMHSARRDDAGPHDGERHMAAPLYQQVLRNDLGERVGVRKAHALQQWRMRCRVAEAAAVQLGRGQWQVNETLENGPVVPRRRDIRRGYVHEALKARQ